MATVIIPDKICPHCGGNKWFISTTGQVVCSRLNNERSKQYRLRNLEKCRERERAYKHRIVRELSDTYIIFQLKSLGFADSQINDITMEKYRSYVKIHRKVGQLNREVMDKQKQDVEELKRQYEELGNSLSSLPSEKKNAVYQKRSYIKKKLMSIGEYENLAVLGVETKQSLDEMKAELETLQPDFDKSYEERKKVYDRRKKLKEVIKTMESEYNAESISSIVVRDTKTVSVQEKEQKDEMTYAEVIEKISALSSQIQELYAKISGLISEHNKYVELLKFETL